MALSPQVHEKYHSYRQRLLSQFMVPATPDSPARTTKGRNIPAERIMQSKGWQMYWTDGTLYQGHWIGVLATEYLLLNQAGKDCTPTLDLLCDQLDTLKRLQEAATDFFATPAEQMVPGFMVRDDVDEETLGEMLTPIETAKGTQIMPFVSDTQQFKGSPAEQVKTVTTDQVNGLFVGFALVVKYVPASLQHRGQFPVQEVQALTRSIIKHLKDSDWYVQDPAGNRTDLHDVFRKEGDAWNVAHAAAFILGNKPKDNIGNMPAARVAFWRAKFGLMTTALSWGLHKQQDFAVAHIAAGLAVGQVKPNSAALLLVLAKSAKYNYLLYPLLFHRLHNAPKPQPIMQAIENALETAPEEGPYFRPMTKPNDDGEEGWRSTNRWVRGSYRNTGIFNEKEGQRNYYSRGYYNGLDFLLLYNLYMLPSQ